MKLILVLGLLCLASSNTHAQNKADSIKSLDSVSVQSKPNFIVVQPDKIILNIAASPLAAGGNAYDVILRTPGMSENNGSLNFRMQSSIQVLINGRPSNLSGDALKTMLSNMPANRIEKIEVLTNPSSKYDAVAGTIINIILAKAKGDGANFTYTGGIGTGKYLLGNSGLDFNYRNGKVNMYGGYSYNHNKQYTDGNTLTTTNLYSIHSQDHDILTKNNHTYNIGTDYYLNQKTTIGFMLNGYYNKHSHTENNYSYLLENNQSINPSSVLTNGNAKYSSPSANIYLQSKLDSQGNELSINADYFNYNKSFDDHLNTFFSDDSSSNMWNHSPANNNVYALSADFTHPTQKGTWEFGVKSSYAKTDNNILWQTFQQGNWASNTNMTNHFIYKENINAAYLNYARAFKYMRMNLGLRGEQTNTNGFLINTNTEYKRHYFNLFPTVSLMYMKTYSNIYSVTYKRSIYRFDYNVVNPFITYQNQYSYTQGNPNIQPMLFDQATFSWIHNQWLNASVSYTHVQKMISLIYTKGNNQTIITSYDNLNHGDIVSLVVSASKKIGVWQSTLTAVGGYLSYSNMDTVSHSNNTGWMGKIQWQNTVSLKKGWSFESSTIYSSPMANGVMHMKQLLKEDIGVSKTILDGNGSIKLSVSDIFNSYKVKYDYQNAGIYTNNRSKNETRFLNLTFKYKFGNKQVKAATKRNSGVSDLQNRMNN